MAKLLLPASLATILSACGAPTAVGYAPNTSAEERDELHRTSPPPEIASERKLRSATVTDVFDVPLGFVPSWFTSLPLEKALPGTDEIPGVSGTEPLTKSPWGENGARRRVVLDDGSTALEQVVDANLPERFRYIVWNYTSDAAKSVRYGVGEFRFTPEGDGTRVEWTYSLAARRWPATWFLGRFVNRDYRDMMEVSLQAMKSHAEASWRCRLAERTSTSPDRRRP